MANVAGNPFTVSRTMIARHYANVAWSQFTVSRTMIEWHYANVARSHFTVLCPMIYTHCSLSNSVSSSACHPRWCGQRLAEPPARSLPGSRTFGPITMLMSPGVSNRVTHDD